MPVKLALQTRYIVQSYVLDKRNLPRPSLAVVCDSQTSAERQAHKMMATDRISGVHVISQACDPDFDEYEDPVVVLELGHVPDE
jgi:hypothetical protein